MAKHHHTQDAGATGQEVGSAPPSPALRSDPKPDVDWYDNGLFIGYNSDETWPYFRFPEDVRTSGSENPRDAIYNQSDFTKVVAAFGTELDAQRERMKKDKRREFHIQITQSRFKGIIPPADATPEMKDYLYRMSLCDSYKEMMSIANEQKLETRYSKPIWNGYIGIKLHNKGIFSNQHGFSQRFERYKDFFFGRLSEEYLRNGRHGGYPGRESHHDPERIPSDHAVIVRRRLPQPHRRLPASRTRRSQCRRNSRTLVCVSRSTAFRSSLRPV